MRSQRVTRRVFDEEIGLYRTFLGFRVRVVGEHTRVADSKHAWLGEGAERWCSKGRVRARRRARPGAYVIHKKRPMVMFWSLIPSPLERARKMENGYIRHKFYHFWQNLFFQFWGQKMRIDFLLKKCWSRSEPFSDRYTHMISVFNAIFRALSNGDGISDQNITIERFYE